MSSSHNQTYSNHEPCHNLHILQNNRPAADVYKQAYQILMNNERDQHDVSSKDPAG